MTDDIIYYTGEFLAFRAQLSLISLITSSAEDVMFVVVWFHCLSVCLSVCMQNDSKRYERIVIKFLRNGQEL